MDAENLPTNQGLLIGSYASIARMLDDLSTVPGVRGVMMTFDDRAIDEHSALHLRRVLGLPMGVLPLQFVPGTTAASLGLDGTEAFDIVGFSAGLTPGMRVSTRVRRTDGRVDTIELLCRLDTPVEVQWLQSGGILPHALQSLVSESELAV